MMTKKEYNGWYNYQTWLVHLWLSNDEGSYEWSRELSRTAETLYSYIGEKDDYFKDAIEEMIGGEDEWTGLKYDLLNSALSEVNWREVREAFLEE